MGPITTLGPNGRILTYIFVEKVKPKSPANGFDNSPVMYSRRGNDYVALDQAACYVASKAYVAFFACVIVRIRAKVQCDAAAGGGAIMAHVKE